MTKPKDTSTQTPEPLPGQLQLQRFMYLLRVLPEVSRQPDDIDRQMNKVYGLGIDMDRPKEPGDAHRAATRIFCDLVPPQNLTALMRDEQLRQEFRELLDEVPVAREALSSTSPFLLALIETDPPQPRPNLHLVPEL